MKKRGFRFIILVMACLTVKGQDTVRYTLKQCIEVAVTNNLNLKLSEFQSQSNDVRLQQARANNLPYLSAYASQGVNSGKSINPYTNTFINQQIVTGQYGISGGWVLWNGFNNVNSMRQSLFAYEAGKSDWEQAKIDLTIHVILAYLNILSCEEQLKQAESQVEVSKWQSERLSVLEKNNAVTPSVLYDTRGQLANDKLSLLNLKSTYTSAIATLEQLMNTSFTQAVKFEKIEINGNLTLNDETTESIFTDAQKNYPAFKSAEYKRMSASRGLYGARGLIFPSLTLNGSIGTNYSGAASVQRITGSNDVQTDQYVVVNNTNVPVVAPSYNFSSEKISFGNQFKNNLNSYVGVTLQFNIFNSLRTKSQMNLAKINKVQAEFQQKSISNTIKSVIKQAHGDLKISFERMEILQQQVKDYELSFKIATAKFEKGSIGTVEYITAKSNYDKSSMALIAGRYDCILKQKVLEYYRGK